MTDEAKSPELTPLQKAEARRAERKAERQALYDAQRAIDLEALADLEAELDQTNVGYVDVPFMPGSVTLAIIRTPKRLEFKRYQDKLKNNPKDTSGPAEELGQTCLKYPAGEVLAALVEARPGLLVELGVLGLSLTTGRIADEGKG